MNTDKNEIPAPQGERFLIAFFSSTAHYFCPYRHQLLTSTEILRTTKLVYITHIPMSIILASNNKTFFPFFNLWWRSLAFFSPTVIAICSSKHNAWLKLFVNHRGIAHLGKIIFARQTPAEKLHALLPQLFAVKGSIFATKLVLLLSVALLLRSHLLLWYPVV